MNKTTSRTTFEQWRSAAEHAVAPELAALETLRDKAVVYRDSLRTPPEPSAAETHELSNQLREAWEKGDDGRAILDAFTHPWLTNPRVVDFRGATAIRAFALIESDITAARHPRDAHIHWLNEQAQTVLTKAREQAHDLNARREYGQTFDAALAAYQHFAIKLDVTPDDIKSGIAWLGNITELSLVYKAKLDGREAWKTQEPWPTSQNHIFEWLIDTPRAELHLRTRTEIDDLVEMMRQAVWDATEQRKPRSQPLRRRASI